MAVSPLLTWKDLPWHTIFSLSSFIFLRVPTLFWGEVSFFAGCRTYWLFLFYSLRSGWINLISSFTLEALEVFKKSVIIFPKYSDLKKKSQFLELGLTWNCFETDKALLLVHLLSMIQHEEGETEGWFKKKPSNAWGIVILMRLVRSLPSPQTQEITGFYCG